MLKGASLATHPRMRHRKYRNYFTPERNDIHAGWRNDAPLAAPARQLVAYLQSAGGAGEGSAAGAQQN